MKLFFRLALLIISTTLFASSPKSVVKIFATSNSPNFFRPWQSAGTSSGTGSGCIIDGNKILTNAHVVTDTTFIQVKKNLDHRKYTARLVAIGHDCDLALLEVDDPKFFEGTKPFKIDTLPKLEDTVMVLGFPLGGDKLSITKGVVSRIERVPYSHSGHRLLTAQIDAAINPGNSGGPVVNHKGDIVGVAFQGNTRGENMGHMIPVPVINHFLADLKDGEYGGFPRLGIIVNNTENPALRKTYKIDNYEGGVLISKIMKELQPAEESKTLETGDIIMAIDGHKIGEDATFKFRNGERLTFGYLIDKHQAGEVVDLDIVRDGKQMKIKVIAQNQQRLVPDRYHFKKPSYYIYGGLVFSVLSVDLLSEWKMWWKNAPLSFLHYRIGSGEYNTDNKKEVVVLLSVLPDKVNIGYHNISTQVIAAVNDTKIDGLQKLVEICEQSKEGVICFESDEFQKIYLDRSQIKSVNKGILERYNISARFSEDVSKWVKVD